MGDEPHTSEDLAAYRCLVLAVVQRALRDARGDTRYPGGLTPAQIVDSAQQWLDEGHGQALLELAGYDMALPCRT